MLLLILVVSIIIHYENLCRRVAFNTGIKNELIIKNKKILFILYQFLH